MCVHVCVCVCVCVCACVTPTFITEALYLIILMYNCYK